MADEIPQRSKDFDWAALCKKIDKTDEKPIEKPVAYEFSTGRKFVQNEFTGNYTPP